MWRIKPNRYIVFSLFLSFFLIASVFYTFQASRAESRAFSLTGVSSLEYASFIGGTGDDWVADIGLGADGSIYLTGGTYSDNFGPAGEPSTDSDVFVVKLSPDGHTIQYLQIFGGGGEDAARAIDVDPDGNVYITGYTHGGSFPVTNNAFDTSFNGGVDSEVDAFIVKLDPQGAIVYSSFLGGSGFIVPPNQSLGGEDIGYDIAVAGEFVFITGSTQSSDFPTIPGAYDTTYGNIASGMSQDAFVVKMKLDGQGISDMVYGTFLGGNGGIETGTGIRVDTAGDIYAVGSVNNDFDAEFPRTNGAVDMILEIGDTDGFLVKLTPELLGEDDLVYATLLGGVRYDEIHDLALDENNSVYLVGETGSADFLTTSGAFDPTCGTDGTCNYVQDWRVFADAFVTWINPDPLQPSSQNLLYSSFLGGSDIENSIGDSGIQVLQTGEVIIGGSTRSIDTFPTTSLAIASELNGTSLDVFAVRLELNGHGENDLVYGTYYGGTGMEDIGGLAINGNHSIFFGGGSQSSDLPITSDALFDTHNGGSITSSDGYLVKLATATEPDLSNSYMQVSSLDGVVGDTVTYTIGLLNSGNLIATAQLTNTIPDSLLVIDGPFASLGSSGMNGSQVTWSGEIIPASMVTITYTAEIYSESAITPTIVNQAAISDGIGNIYVVRVMLNGHYKFIPLINR